MGGRVSDMYPQARGPDQVLKPKSARGRVCFSSGAARAGSPGGRKCRGRAGAVQAGRRPRGGGEPAVLPPGFEEVASEELEPEEEAVEDSQSDEDSEALDVISSEELELLSDTEPSEGCSGGGGGSPSEDLEFVSSEDEAQASPGDPEELIEELLGEELPGEDGGPELLALLAPLPPLPRGTGLHHRKCM